MELVCVCVLVRKSKYIKSCSVKKEEKQVPNNFVSRTLSFVNSHSTSDWERCIRIRANERLHITPLTLTLAYSPTQVSNKRSSVGRLLFRYFINFTGWLAEAY